MRAKAAMEIERPLLLLFAFLPPLGLLILHFLKKRTPLDGWLRVATLSFGLAALSSPSILFRVETPRIFFLIDRSASCRHYHSPVTDLIHKKIRRLPRNAEIALVAFDSVPELLWQGRVSEFPAPFRLDDFDGKASDLLSSLLFLSAHMKEGERSAVYLFGDGNYRQQPINIPRNESRPFTLYPLLLPIPPDAAIESVSVPPAKKGETFQFYITVASNYETDAELHIWLPDGEKKSLPLHLKSGRTTVASVTKMTETTSLIRINLKSRNDTDASNNSVNIHIHPAGIGRILYVSSSPRRALGEALSARTSDSVEWRPPQTVPQNLNAVELFDAVVLDDVPLDELPKNFVGALAKAVEEGGVGLLVAGAHRSFGSGGYAETPIERILPLNCTPKERTPLMLTLLLDSSSSMAKEVFVEDVGRRTKFDVAVESAISALHALRKGDSLSFITFRRDPTVVRSLIPLEDEEEITELSAKLHAIRPAGGTNIPRALNTALKQFEKSRTTGQKAVLLISDGDSPTENIDYQKFNELQVNIHTISTGGLPKHKAFLKEIARRTDGTFSETEFSPQALRNLFLDILGKIERYLSDYGDHSVRTEEGLPRLPPVRLFSRTAPKDKAEVIGYADENYPLLARWRVGAGATAALTTSIDQESAPKWLEWNRLASFINDILVSYIMRRNEKGRWSLDFDYDEQKLYIHAPKDSPPLKSARILLDREYPLLPRTPTVYEAEMGIEGDFTGVAIIKEGDRIVTTLPVNILSTEQRSVDVDVKRLKRIASAYSGEVLRANEFVEHRPEGWNPKKVELWSYLIILSLCSLLLSLLLRLLHLRR